MKWGECAHPTPASGVWGSSRKTRQPCVGRTRWASPEQQKNAPEPGVPTLMHEYASNGHVWETGETSPIPDVRHQARRRKHLRECRMQRRRQQHQAYLGHAKRMAGHGRGFRTEKPAPATVENELQVCQFSWFCSILVIFVVVGPVWSKLLKTSFLCLNFDRNCAKS